MRIMGRQYGPCVRDGVIDLCIPKPLVRKIISTNDQDATVLKQCSGVTTPGSMQRSDPIDGASFKIEEFFIGYVIIPFSSAAKEKNFSIWQYRSRMAGTRNA
jgi:hypothetical protein